MLTVGIHENLVLSKALVNDKGTLQLELRQKGDSAANDTSNPFALASSGDVIEDSSNKLLVFAPNVPKTEKADGTSRSEKERSDLANNDLIEMTNSMKHMLSVFITKDEIAKLFEGIYNNTGFNMKVYQEQGPSSFTELLFSEDRMKIVYTNVFTAFVQGITPFLDKDDHAIRLKLIRQSADKHYPKLPGAKYVSTQPFIESMSIPADQSKVKFTDYEKSKGLDSGVPISSASADPLPSADSNADMGVFGGR